jgi:chromosome segregation ATPase
MKSPTIRKLVRQLPAIAATTLVIGGFNGAYADSNPGDDRLRDQLRQTTLQLRQTEDENAELKAKVDTLSQQAAAAQPAPKKASDDNPQLRHQLAESNTKVADLQQQLDAAQKTLEQWKTAYQQATTLARTRDTDARNLDAKLHESDAHTTACEDKNAKLVQLSDELLQRYKGKGVWESLRNDEPLTQLHQVQLQQLAQEYHGRIVDATMPQPAGSAQ